MTDIIIQKAIEEIEAKTFGVTKQFLEVHQVVYVDEKPKISRIDRDNEDGTAIVYFPIVDEEFYLAVYLDTEPQVLVRAIHTEPRHSVYYGASSEALSLKELSALTILTPTECWDKGDKRKFGNLFQNYAFVAFEPNPEADEFEDKIKKLLDFLEEDIDGIRKLADEANGFIRAASNFHNGNTMLGGYHLDKSIIKRLASLNLEIYFDIKADGNMW